MVQYAVKENDDGDFRLLEYDLAISKWRRIATDLDEESLAAEIFELLSDGDLEAEQPIIRMLADGSREHIRAIELVSADQRRQLGYVISARPVMLPLGDPAGRRRSP